LSISKERDCPEAVVLVLLVPLVLLVIVVSFPPAAPPRRPVELRLAPAAEKLLDPRTFFSKVVVIFKNNYVQKKRGIVDLIVKLQR
jgi:hypothetical protein